MELKGLRHRQAEFINAVKETEKNLRKLGVETKLVCLMF